MTNIVVAKIKDAGGNSINPDVKKGMKKAGTVINDHLADPTKIKRSLFKRLYKRLVETNGKYAVYVRDAAGNLQELANVNNKYRKFETPAGDIYKIVTVVDDEDSDNDDDFIKMHIAVPATNQNLLADGYIGNVVGDIDELCNNGISGANAVEEVKQYLLATVFLSRCH